MHTMLKLAAPLALAITGSAHAATYDLAANFSNASNPNGAWSYGSPALAHFAQPTTANSLNSAAADGYWSSGADFFAAPFILRTTANGVSTGAYNNGDFLAGDVLVHGPNDGSAVAINWIAAAAGSINFTSSIWYAHSIVQRSEDVAVFLNGTSLGSVTVTNGITRTNALTSLAGSNLAVAAGDVLSFRFSKTAGQQFGSLAGIGAVVDFTPRATAAVPEPATWGMMILGFGAVGMSIRRRKQVHVSFV
ncbi:MAG: PEPxxWA-CTERM sorting domain-containing protein [Pseudomonadota bacterium]